MGKIDILLPDTPADKHNAVDVPSHSPSHTKTEECISFGRLANTAEPGVQNGRPVIACSDYVLPAFLSLPSLALGESGRNGGSDPPTCASVSPSSAHP
jgi:hypothetical protein